MFKSIMPFGRNRHKNEKCLSSDASDPTPDSAIRKAPKGCGLHVTVLAKPGAKHNGITDMTTEGIRVQISAPPVEGEANSELVKYMARVLGLRKSDVTLERGSKSRTKTLSIDNVSVEQATQLIQKEIDGS